MKKDLRQACEQGTSCPGALCHSCCVSLSDAHANAHGIRADRYAECSAKTGEGMDELLEAAGAEAARRAIVRAATTVTAPVTSSPANRQ
ncbi:hypothetical protein CDD83_9909 [Cordyceps sp. RAO-2017]|nr:hypothetical protein CDD83_9909 [Cordyceps sp. RAO-2017]